MTARTAGFRTREQIGLKRARSRSTRVDPKRGGVAIHWAGPGAAPATLAGAERLWRQWQNMHMSAPRNWADIAYSVGVTQTGHVLAGRGYGVRTAAQGTNDGNDRYLAVVWVGGEDSEPTQEALDAIEWAVADFQSKGAGLSVRSHRTFHSTSCAGDRLTRLAQALDGKRLTKGATTVATPPPAALPVHRVGDRVLRPASPTMRGTDVQAVQRWVGAEDDGSYGPKTVDAVKVAQGKVGVPQNGVVDQVTWHHYAAWVKWRADLAKAARDKAAAEAAARPALPKLGAFVGPHLSRGRNAAKYHGGVKKLQEALARLGLYRLNSDQPGRFGDDTERAVVALQRARKIKDNGVVGPQTWAELERWS